MLNYFAFYLAIGAVFMFLVEVAMKYNKSKEELNNIERIIGILGWPLFLSQYIKKLIKILRNKYDE